jgi:hypothetical protein
MAEETEIAWTDSTFNPWWGCSKVGAGCDHCYAESLDKRTGGGLTVKLSRPAPPAEPEINESADSALGRLE